MVTFLTRRLAEIIVQSGFFFTDLIKKEKAGTVFEYKKSKLAEAYSVEANAAKVRALIACRIVQ